MFNLRPYHILNGRWIVRSQTHVRYISSSNSKLIFKSSLFPKFGKNLFTKKSLENINDSSFSGEVEVNPLFSMTKDQIVELNGMKYKKLTSLPMQAIEESQYFCINVAEIINENLLKDQRLIASLIHNIHNDDLKSIILTSVKRMNFGNKIKLSMIEMLLDIESEQFRNLFTYILQTIMDKSPTKTEKLELVFNYMENLCLLNVLNPNPIVIPNDLYDDILSVVPNVKIAQFYSYLFNLNALPETQSKLKGIQLNLINGREIDRYTLRTGELNAKWHDTVKPLNDETHRKKMFNFFTFDMIKSFTYASIKKNDIVDANLYLDLLVSKFEATCNDLTNSVFVLDDIDTKISDNVQEILKVIMMYLMKFKGGEACIEILEYMVRNNLEIKFNLLHSMMQQLIEQKHYEEAVILVNSIDLDKLSAVEKSRLVTQIFHLMELKFSGSPNVLLGYALSIFKNPLTNKTVIDVLNELEILGLVMGSGVPEVVTAPKVVPASVDQRLVGLRFLHKHLYHVYSIALRNVKGSPVDLEIIKRLFSPYISGIKNTNYKCLRADLVDDKVITLFLNHLLKQNPRTQEWVISDDRNRYDLAKEIVSEFYNDLKLSSVNLKPYPFLLMIYCALINHNDYSFATQLIKISKSHNLPLTFNQIYPFIIYHYKRQEYDNAKYWYDLLVHSGITAKSTDMRNVYKIARELKWDITGFVYRKNIIHKNYAKREALKDMKKDKLAFLGNKPQEKQQLSNITFAEKMTALLQNK